LAGLTFENSCLAKLVDFWQPLPRLWCGSTRHATIEQLWDGIAKPGPEFDPDFFIFKVNVLKTFEVVPFWLGSG